MPYYHNLGLVQLEPTFSLMGISPNPSLALALALPYAPTPTIN